MTIYSVFVKGISSVGLEALCRADGGVRETENTIMLSQVCNCD